MKHNKRVYSTPKSDSINLQPENVLLNTSSNATIDMGSTHNVLKDTNAAQYAQKKDVNNPIWSNMSE